MPWVLAWVVRAAGKHVPGGKWPDGLAGAVCGLCILLRYASLFLVVYAAGLMLCSPARLLSVDATLGILWARVAARFGITGIYHSFLLNAPVHPWARCSIIGSALLCGVPGTSALAQYGYLPLGILAAEGRGLVQPDGWSVDMAIGANISRPRCARACSQDIWP